MRQQPWICCQIGAREHYAIPRILNDAGILGVLVTETWAPPGNVYGLMMRRLRERYHSELRQAPVYAWNSDTIIFELSAKLHKLSGWPLILERNRWFQKCTIKVLSELEPRLESNNTRPTLFVYSYAALELLRYAKARGWQAILGQIDGGVCEEAIVANEHRQYRNSNSEWWPAPSAYWSDWEQECSLADKIIVNSDWSKQLLVDAGINAEKLHVIPVAYEADAIASNYSRVYPTNFSVMRPLRVLFLGAFSLRKGAIAVLEAIRLLMDEPVEFWIVGKVGVKIPSVIRESPKVKWFGPVSRASTADYYRKADVFLFPTLSDGFGMTQVEARGWKLPVIASPFCPPIIGNGINGLIIAEVSAQSIRDAILTLLNDPITLRKLSEGSTEEYRDYSMQNVREKILSLAG